jgi:hypothetical protein
VLAMLMIRRRPYKPRESARSALLTAQQYVTDDP